MIQLMTLVSESDFSSEGTDCQREEDTSEMREICVYCLLRGAYGSQTYHTDHVSAFHCQDNHTLKSESK
jgi:hypothetical protein